MDDEVIFRALLGNASDQEMALVKAWRQASREHEATYREMAEILTLAGDDEASRSPGPPPAVHQLMRSPRPDVNASFLRSWRGHQKSWIQRGLIAAAMLVLGFGISEIRTAAESDLDFAPYAFTTGPGETSTVSLRDGTVVRLAPNTRLRIFESVGERAVALEGRAYFAVARNERRPFRIRTGTGQVEVLGTRFDVATDGDNLRVVVVEGEVAVSASGKHLTVNAGEVSQVIEGRVLPPVKVRDVGQMLDWTGDFLAFQATPLKRAALEIGKHYGVDVQIADPAIGDRTITTWFSHESLEEVLGIVCFIAEVQCSIKGKLVTIGRR